MNIYRVCFETPLQGLLALALLFRSGVCLQPLLHLQGYLAHQNFPHRTTIGA